MYMLCMCMYHRVPTMCVPCTYHVLTMYLPRGYVLPCTLSLPCAYRVQAVLACVHGSTSRGSSPQLVDDLGAPSSTTSSVGSSSPPSINGAAAMRAGVGAVLSAGRFVSPRRACLRGSQADTILEAAVEARLRPRRTSDTMLAGVARKIELLTIKARGQRLQPRVPSLTFTHMQIRMHQAREAALRQQQLKIRELLEQALLHRVEAGLRTVAGWIA